MNAVHGSIIENLRHLEIVYEPTVSAFKGDRTHTSESKEITISQFLKSYLPSDFQVKGQSKIYSRTQETQNIDCVVLSPNHPKLITPKREVVLAEGVFAAIEVKPDISTLTEKSEFCRGLKQIKSVKQIERNIKRLDLTELTGNPPRDKYYDKIPAVIFAFKSTSLEKTITFIREKVNDNTIGYDEVPDLVVSLEKGIIYYSPILDKTGIAPILKSIGHSVPKSGFATIESTNKENNLIKFLELFFKFSASQPILQRSNFIVKKYLEDIESGKINKIYSL